MNKILITVLQYAALPALNFVIKRVIRQKQKAAEEKKKLEEKIRKKILKEKEALLNKAEIDIKREMK